MMRITVLYLLTAFLFGCGDKKSELPDMGGDDGRAVAELVEEMSDATSNTKKLNKLFANGSKPPELSKLKGCMFYIVGKPTVSGTSAEAKVKIDKGAQSSEKDWTFEKVGDKWKIKTAPL